MTDRGLGIYFLVVFATLIGAFFWYPMVIVPIALLLGPAAIFLAYAVLWVIWAMCYAVVKGEFPD